MTSIVNVAELQFGIAKSPDNQKVRRREELAMLFEYVDILPLDVESAIRYGELRALLERAGTPIGPLDTLIAAIALSHDATLVTNNVREFSRVPGLRVENWLDPA